MSRTVELATILRPAAGAAAVLLAACAGVGRTPPSQSGDEVSTETGPPVYVGADAVVGADVVAPSGELLGRIEDLRFDLRRGRVARVVVAVAGEGAATTARRAAPFEKVRFDPGQGRILLRITARELAGLPGIPEVEAIEARAELGIPDFDDELLFESQEIQTLSGEVTRLDPAPMETASEPYLLLRLRTPDNRFHRILLGPQGSSPDPGPLARVGASVRVEAVKTRDWRGMLWLAKSVEIAGRTFHLRDRRGGPLWIPPPPRAAEIGTPDADLVSLRGLATALLTARDGPFGTVRTVIVRADGGREAFVCAARPGYRPGDLGPVVIPLGALELGAAGELRVDRTVGELLLAPRVPPGAPHELDEGGLRAAVYGFFGVSRALRGPPRPPAPSPAADRPGGSPPAPSGSGP